jgi:hypothetical protein
MRLELLKAGRFGGPMLTIYALLTGAMTLILMVSSRATLGHVVGEGVTRTPFWGGLCGGAASVLARLPFRVRLIR